MEEKIKTDVRVDRLFLVLKLKKISGLAKYIRKFFFIVEINSSLSTSVLIFSIISQIRKDNFIYFGHKHVETEPNCSHKLTTFFKYHMPLINNNIVISKSSIFYSGKTFVNCCLFVNLKQVNYFIFFLN